MKTNCVGGTEIHNFEKYRQIPFHAMRFSLSLQKEESTDRISLKIDLQHFLRLLNLCIYAVVINNNVLVSLFR